MKNIIKKYKNYLSQKKFTKDIKSQKTKLYSQVNSTSRYKSKRNKYKLFISKLEFQNTFPEIKNLNYYYFIIWGFLILSCIYVLFFSHYFTVKSIDVIREDDLVNIDLAYKSLEKYRYNSIFTIDKNLINASILSHQPNIKEVYIRKIMPDNLKITLKSYDLVFGTNILDKYYLITQNWVIVPSKQKESDEIIKVIWLNNLWIIDYKKVFNSQFIKKIKDIDSLIKQENSFLEVKDIKYYLKEQEIHIISKEDIVIIFDLHKDINVQIQKLNIFFKKYLSTIKSWIVYIDLRINEKIIYCWKDQEFQCKQNLKSIYE